VDSITVTHDTGAPTVEITTNGGLDYATNGSPTLLEGRRWIRR